MFILCNDDNRADFVQWANTPKLSGGFPQANILSNGASGNQRSGLFGDVDIFLQQTGGGASDLVVRSWTRNSTFTSQYMRKPALARSLSPLNSHRLSSPEKLAMSGSTGAAKPAVGTPFRIDNTTAAAASAPSSFVPVWLLTGAAGDVMRMRRTFQPPAQPLRDDPR